MSIADDLKAEVCGGCEHADLRTPFCDICRKDAFVPVVAELEKVVRFVAEESNWHSPSRGFVLQYDPEPAPIFKAKHMAREALK